MNDYGDALRGFPDRVAGEMRIAGNRLDPAVSEKPADDRQPFAERERPRGEAMADVVDAHVMQSGLRADARPRPVDVGHVSARLRARDYVPAHCKPGTQEVYRNALEIHVVPRLGKRRVAEIERADMVALHHELRATPYQANRTIQVLSRIFTLAEVWGLRADGSNPCRHVKRFREEKRERFLSDAEYGRLGAALKQSEVEELEPPSAIAAIRLLMLTGCRKSEILLLRWEHVDLEAGELRLPDSKTGAKVVHLGDPAISVLRGMSRNEGNPWVLPGRKTGKPMSDLDYYWQRIRDRTGLKGVRVHYLRHSCVARLRSCLTSLTILLCNLSIFSQDNTRLGIRLGDSVIE